MKTYKRFEDLKHKNSPEKRAEIRREVLAELATVERPQISCNLGRAGDKWYVVMRATGYEDDIYEFDDEETARKALAAALKHAQAYKVEGLVQEMVIRRTQKDVGHGHRADDDGTGGEAGR